ncbi:MAG: hypothetical protein KF819_16470 [Labilithrix sp.]|nr:hypothetical protein [Labilithrix sp.]
MLDESIRAWRSELEASMRAEDLDELESHLRDAIDAEMACGASAEEAFAAAHAALGDTKALVAEHAKVHPSARWRGPLGDAAIGALAAVILGAVGAALLRAGQDLVAWSGAHGWPVRIVATLFFVGLPLAWFGAVVHRPPRIRRGAVAALALAGLAIGLRVFTLVDGFADVSAPGLADLWDTEAATRPLVAVVAPLFLAWHTWQGRRSWVALGALAGSTLPVVESLVRAGLLVSSTDRVLAMEVAFAIPVALVLAGLVVRRVDPVRVLASPAPIFLVALSVLREVVVAPLSGLAIARHGAGAFLQGLHASTDAFFVAQTTACVALVALAAQRRVVVAR